MLFQHDTDSNVLLLCFGDTKTEFKHSSFFLKRRYNVLQLTSFKFE